MILNKDRMRVLAHQWRYLALSLALIAGVSLLLISGRVGKADRLGVEIAKANGQLPPPQQPAEIDEPQEGVAVEYDKQPGPYRWPMGQATEYVQLIRLAIYAYMHQDASFFERALDESYTGAGPGGEIIYKEQEIMAVKQGDRKIKRFDFDLLHISVRGETAFSTFQATVYYDDNGRVSSIPYRYTVNLIKKDGQPKITAIHKSRMQ